MASETLDVVIIGAGLSGIGGACPPMLSLGHPLIALPRDLIGTFQISWLTG
jgi:hypothetical protein